MYKELLIEFFIVIGSTALGSLPQLNSYERVFLIYQQNKKMLFFSHSKCTNWPTTLNILTEL
jgi:hypothetical protein